MSTQPTQFSEQALLNFSADNTVSPPLLTFGMMYWTGSAWTRFSSTTLDGLYIRLDGTTTTSARIPFAQGIRLPQEASILLGGTNDSTAYASIYVQDAILYLDNPNSLLSRVLTPVRIQSTVATGTAPFTIASTTVCTNLNADLLDGVHASGFIQTDGSSTTTAIIPFAAGIYLPGEETVTFGGTSASSNSVASFSVTDTTFYLNNPFSLATLFHVAINMQVPDSWSLTWQNPSFVGSITSTDAGLFLDHNSSYVQVAGEDSTILLSASLIQSTGSIQITNTAPSISFQDSTAAQDDFQIRVDSSTLDIRNTTDARNDISISGTGVITLQGAGGIVLNANPQISKAQPFITFTDTAGDDFEIGMRASNTFAITNTSDATTFLAITAAGALTLGSTGGGAVIVQNGKGGTIAFQPAGDTANLTLSSTSVSSGANITITKATPAIFLTDSGGDDYTIDVGSTASLLRIRNVTDSSNGLQINGTGQVAVSTNYAPQTIYKLYAQDRSVAAAPGANLAALSSAFEYIPAADTTTSASNLHGYEGGITVTGTSASISGGGVFIGLRGNCVFGMGSGKTISNTGTGLFGTFSASQNAGSGTATQGNAVATFVSVGASSTVTTLSHFRVGSTSNSGTITTLYGLYIPALTAGSANYEIWHDTDGGSFFREAGNYMYSSASATLDVVATTTMNFRIGGTTEATLTANGLHVVDNLRATGSAVIQSSSFTPYATAYELSVQSAGTTSYIEIQNSTATGGMFFGMASDEAEIWNYQGVSAGSGAYPIKLYGGIGSALLLTLDLDAQGGAVFTQVVKAAGYKSSDGSTGATGTGTAANTLTIKNGLVTNIA